MKKILAILSILLATSLGSRATIYTLTGSSNYLTPATWNTPINWSPTYPGLTIANTDTVSISGFAEIPLATNVNINGTVIIETISTPYHALLFANGGLTVSNSGIIMIGAGFVANGNVDLYGTITTGAFQPGFTQGVGINGTLVIHPGGNLNLYTAPIILPYLDSMEVNGVLTVNGTFTNDGYVWNTGSIIGTGSINTSNSSANGIIQGAGSVAPGLSPGELKTDFDYSLSSNGKLEIEIGGLIPGNEYDVLGGSGNKTLGGTLDVTLYNSYVPAVGDSYTIITGASVTDTFTTINYPNLPGSMFWEIEYNTTNVVLKVNAATRLAEIDDLKDITLYPNPSNGKLLIEGLQNGIYNYNLYTVTGQRIETGELTNNTLSIESKQSQLLYVEIINDKMKSVIKPIFLLR